MKLQVRFVHTFYLFVTITAFLFSCTEPVVSVSNSFPEQSVDTLKIDVGFSYQSKQFDFEGKTYIYLYDLTTFKRVKLFDEELNWLKTYSLDTYLAGTDYSLSNLEMITPDSLILMTNYATNSLISVNAATEERKIVALNSIFPFPELKPSLEFESTMFYGFRYKDELVFKMSASIPSLRALNPQLDNFQMLRKFDSINKALPAYVMVQDPFSASPKTREVEYSDAFKTLFADANYVSMNYAFIGNDKIISVSRYQDYIDVYDFYSGKSIKKNVASKFTDLGVPVRLWKDYSTLTNSTDEFNNDLKRAGNIVRMFYDEKAKQYHFLLWYSEKANPNQNPKQVSPFIWQVYDENFVLLDEREHAPTDLIISFAIATKKYIYFPCYNEKTYDPYEAVLVRYTF